MPRAAMRTGTASETRTTRVDHRRVDVGRGAGAAGAEERGGEKEAGEHAAGNRRVDGPVLDVGGDQRARRRPAEGEDDEGAGDGRYGGVGHGGAELDRAAAGGERDQRVEEGEGETPRMSRPFTVVISGSKKM